MEKIFLGVGHGGIDSGAVGLNGIKEKDINLAIAKTCRDELERHNVQVLMSRTSDENDDLREEIAECNAYNPTLAVDIHNNAGGGDGFEAFYSVLNTNNGKMSRALAEDIETEVKALGQNSRGLKTKVITDGKLKGQDWFGFVREPHCPSILIECAFVDTKDVEIVDTLADQKKMGIAVAKGILKTLGITYRPFYSVIRYYIWVGHFSERKDAEKISATITNNLKCYNEIRKA